MTWKPGDRLPDAGGPGYRRLWAEVLPPHVCTDRCRGNSLRTSDSARWPVPFWADDLDNRAALYSATEVPW